MERFLWVCAGGAVGTGARYLVALWAAQRFGVGFPYGTLFVNLAGCFAMSAVMQAALVFAWSPTVRAALTVGFLGGLTTYSSFNYESTGLVQGGAPGLALLNGVLTIVGCFVAGWLGLVTARYFLPQ